MKECPQCGVGNQDTARICPNCGYDNKYVDRILSRHVPAHKTEWLREGRSRAPEMRALEEVSSSQRMQQLMEQDRIRIQAEKELQQQSRQKELRILKFAFIFILLIMLAIVIGIVIIRL